MNLYAQALRHHAIVLTVALPSNLSPGGSGVVCVALDTSFLVVDKPAGLLAVPGRSDPDNLVTRVQAVWPDTLVVHRLDMATSGLMLLARGPLAQRALSIAFEQRKVNKRYVAIVAGRMAANSGEINLPLIADWPNRPRQMVDHQHGKPSLTRYRVLHHDARANRSRVELEPVTGRSHQLRVHLQASGHPILGDALYAPPEIQAAAPRLLLHAAFLRFLHPDTGEPVEVHSAAPF